VTEVQRDNPCLHDRFVDHGSLSTNLREITSLVRSPVPGTLSHLFLSLDDSGLATVVTSTMVLPLALTERSRRVDWLWAIAFAGIASIASIAFATKPGLFGWGNGIQTLDFRYPSGRAALSAFYGLCVRGC
jgi:hypothetical protein